MDIRKLNKATGKDLYPLPFIDQMLERLSKHTHFCFLDGYSGFSQIPISQPDQEKTTFTCPFGTYWYVSNISTFSHAFPLVLDSNLHDLNETNPGLTLFSVELPWCYFCAEIKVHIMERNFLRIFYIKNKNFWSQDPSERGPWVGTTHQGAPPSPGVPRWVVRTWWPRRPQPWHYNFLFSEKK